MAPSVVDCALICAEENESIYDVDYGFVEEEEGFESTTTWHHPNRNLQPNQSFHCQDSSSSSFSGFPLLSDDCLALMVKRECEHLPSTDYLRRLRNGDINIGARQEAVDWIEKVHAHFGFGPLCAYLSISYLDRFLSAYELPSGKAWIMQLLAVACLSLAAKMEETEVPLCIDLQMGESKFVFEATTIQRMELLVLSTLKWRMQALTPFSFIDYYLGKINGDQMASICSIFRSTKLILSTIKGIDFLEFKPSEIAAAVAISVTAETQTVNTWKENFVQIQHVEKGRVVNCVEVMNELSLLSGSVESVAQSPIGVVDAAAACLSYTSTDESISTVGSFANNSSPQTNKRRKLNRQYCELEI